jgi:hypothetical protein
MYRNFIFKVHSTESVRYIYKITVPEQRNLMVPQSFISIRYRDDGVKLDLSTTLSV